MPPPDYLLAMKTLAARADTHDQSDIEFLIGELNLSVPEQVMEIVAHYYPHKEVKPAVRFLLEEIFERRGGGRAG